MHKYCELEGTLQYLYLMVLSPLSFVVWILIGVVYLFDKKLSLPPGKLISAEAFSYLFNLVSLIAYWPLLKE
jgi:hypothetical protein